MSVPRKDAFIRWYLNERAKATLASGSKPTVAELRESAVKYGYEIRTVMVNGVEIVKIRWSEKAQFEPIDDFVANHQAKLLSSYLDLERRLSICGVSAETKHNSNVRQSEEYIALQRECDRLLSRIKELESIIEELGQDIASTHCIDWDIFAKYNAELSEKWKLEFLRTSTTRP